MIPQIVLRLFFSRHVDDTYNDTSTIGGQEKEKELLLPEKGMKLKVNNCLESEVRIRSSYQSIFDFVNKILECLIHLLVSKFNIGLTIWEKN